MPRLPASSVVVPRARPPSSRASSAGRPKGARPGSRSVVTAAAASPARWGRGGHRFQPRVDDRPIVAQGQAVQPRQRRPAPHLDRLDRAQLAHAGQLVVQAHDGVGGGQLGEEGGVARIGLAGDDGRRPAHAQGAAHVVEELARRLGVDVRPVHARGSRRSRPHRRPPPAPTRARARSVVASPCGRNCSRLRTWTGPPSRASSKKAKGRRWATSLLVGSERAVRSRARRPAWAAAKAIWVARVVLPLTGRPDHNDQGAARHPATEHHVQPRHPAGVNPAAVARGLRRRCPRLCHRPSPPLCALRALPPLRPVPHDGTLRAVTRPGPDHHGRGPPPRWGDGPAPVDHARMTVVHGGAHDHAVTPLPAPPSIRSGHRSLWCKAYARRRHGADPRCGASSSSGRPWRGRHPGAGLTTRWARRARRARSPGGPRAGHWCWPLRTSTAPPTHPRGPPMTTIRTDAMAYWCHYYMNDIGALR